MENTKRAVRHGARLVIRCPQWLKERIVEDADSQDQDISELVRQRLMAPYREAKK